MNIAILDSENIRNLTINMLSGVDRLIVMTQPGQVQIKLTLPCQTRVMGIQYVETVGGGKDNMDWHIVTIIGNYIRNSKIKSIRILSNDLGYTNVISFWKRKGAEIEQLSNLPRKNNKVLQSVKIVKTA